MTAGQADIQFPFGAVLPNMGIVSAMLGCLEAESMRCRVSPYRAARLLLAHARLVNFAT